MIGDRLAPRRVAAAAWALLAARLRPRQPSHEVMPADAPVTGTTEGWRTSMAAERQDAAFRPLLEAMYAGQPRWDFVVAAEAVRRTGIAEPTILEVGCGSGYYLEVLTHILGVPPRYVGSDFSRAMVELARRKYPGGCFLAADGADLPFRDDAFDVVFNGVSLMHMVRWETAIAEARRVARRWCIFHTVPVVAHRPTTRLRHRAYGQTFFELVFNEASFHKALEDAGMAVRHVEDSIPYDLSAVVGEPTTSRTFVCEVVPV